MISVDEPSDGTAVLVAASEGSGNVARAGEGGIGPGIVPPDGNELGIGKDAESALGHTISIAAFTRFG